jgi:hypothetical protein
MTIPITFLSISINREKIPKSINLFLILLIVGYSMKNFKIS